MEEIVHKVIDSNLSHKPNVEIVTNTQTENNGIHVHKVDHTVLSSSEKLQKCDVALLMDSNRKFSKVSKQPKFHCQHTIIFHFGVNDIDSLTIEDIV